MALFRSARSKPTRLGCFGKLPTYGDFISLHQDSPDAHALAEWLQAAVPTLPSGGRTSGDQCLCFVYNPDGVKRSLVGVLWPSTDSAGRSFPFAIFVSVPGPSPVQESPYQAFAVSQVWGQLFELFGRVRSLPSYRDQYALLQSTSPVAVMEADAAAATFPSCLTRGALAEADPARLALQVRDVNRVADQLGQSPQTPRFAVWLPLHQGYDPTVEASMWARMLFAWLAEESAMSLFVNVTQAAGRRGAFFCRRDLRPEDLGFLLGVNDDYGHATIVGGREAPADAEEDRYVGAFVQRWAATPRTCRDLLELGTRAWSAAELEQAPGAAAALAALAGSSGAPTPASAAAAVPVPSMTEMEFVEEETVANVRLEGLAALGDDTGPQAVTQAAAVASEDTGAITGPIQAADVDESFATTFDGSGGGTAVQPLCVAADALRDQTTALHASLRALLQRPLSAGRIVQLAGAGGEQGAAARVFVPEGEGTARVLAGDDAVESGIRDYMRARKELDALVSSNRALEKLLERLLDAACKQTAATAES